METISQVLFWVANSLLIPDILLLLLLFIRALLLVGGIYNQYMAKTQERQATERPDQNLTPDKVDDLRKSAAREQLALHPLSARPADQPGQPGLRRLPDLEFRERRREGRDPVQTSHQDRPRTGSDRHADRHEPGARGTLDGRHRRYVLQYAVVFATTVVGLVISGVGLVSLQFKQRWYARMSITWTTYHGN